MGQTLTNGIYLPNEGERNCYSGLAANWNAVDTLKGNYSLHAINVDIHVTAADKQAWNGHIADSVKHVTAEDKQAWNGKADASALTAHTGDTTIHVTAEDKAKWDAVTSKADDSDVVHKSGNETIGGLKTFENNRMVVGRSTDIGSTIQIVNADVVGDSANGASSLEVYGSSVSDANKIGSITIGEFSNNGGSYATIECNRTASGVKSSNVIRILIRPNGSKELSATVDNDCNLGNSFLRWSKVYAINYYYGNDNVEFSTKFVTTDTNQTVLGNKTFSSINGVEPSSLSLPSGNANDVIDISSYFSNTGTGETNSYVASANGWIYLRLGDISSCQATVYDSNNNRMWGQSTAGSVEQITIPILKGQTLTTQWATGSAVTVATARFIPCQGNI